ncbi:receptor-like protein 6 [Ipomoea triloba]|uniref:receptor-like protein 6 n=1 Tax=Ipomoea triloba TaxID=35885 RepID=UPI00125DF540|nr:receptor-like protein 6 [Ipomoea triloba]
MSILSNQKCVHSQWLALSQLRALNLHSTPVPQPQLPTFSIQTPLPCEGDSSKKVKGWNILEEDCCSWDGVSCDPATGYVIGLDLSFSMLSGEIFPIFNLHHLQTLNLSCNYFEFTPFPSGFEKLRNLTHLNLSHTSFSGQIPVGISMLTRLVSLDLSTIFDFVELRKPSLECFFMNLTSLKEVYLDGVDLSAQASNWSQVLSSALPHLQVLSFSNCHLNGPIHPSFATLKSLSYLQLSFNNLSSDFPKNVFLLPKLKVIDISNNHLRGGQFPEFPKHTSLQTISLSQTNFHGELPESIGNLPSLKILDISSCNLSGSIPSSLANLTSIVKLDISENRFIGSLPPFHSTSVPNLSYLDMSSNLLTGGIHSSLFTLPSLEYLLLDDNKFSGELEDFSNTSFSVLESLDLSDNQLSGVVPKSIFQLPNLTHLSLRSNNFNGSVKIEMLQNLKNLTFLDLSNNSLTVEENDDDRNFHLPQLQYLYLHKCNLSDFPIFLKSQVKLIDLNLVDNHIRGYVPSWLGNNTLQFLDLSGNPLDFLEPSSAQGNNSFVSLYFLGMHSCNISKFPQILKGIHDLQILDLSDNKIEGEIPSWIWKNKLRFVNISHNFLSAINEFSSNISLNVLALYLHGNRIKGSLPSGICNMGPLKVLDASYNNLSGLIPECLVKLASLSVLNLKGNRYDQMPSNFTCAYNNLRSLNINGNRLKGELPRSLANCKMLEILDLGNNMISDTFPFWLEKLPLLKVLVLRNNMFYGEVEIPRTKFVLPSLHIIDLSSNNFTGKLSKYFLQSLSAMAMSGEHKSQLSLIGEHDEYYHDSVTIMNKGYEMVLVEILTIFVSLDLSNNEFHGNVPEEIGELKSLVVLNLSQNVFDGRIPISLGELSQLESLDFSKNKFSGTIPPQLTSLTFLEVLNMSYNQLAGRIPLGNQFNTFTNSSYIGNTGLCGIPLSRKCNEDDAPVAQYDESLESEEAMFDWRFAVGGCGFGLVVGLTIGFAFLAEWIIMWFVKQKKKKQQRRKKKKKAQLTVQKLRR